ncbi:MAG: penicillin-binding protein activator LpoB, partial [Candidatus Zixiibacteriota bacterium]
ATATSGGRGFWGSLFGGGGKPASEVTRDCVRRILSTLVE